MVMRFAVVWWREMRPYRLSVESGADNECKVKSHLALAQMKEKGRSVGTNDGAVIEEVVVVE
jgi:hypothetical protein